MTKKVITSFVMPLCIICACKKEAVIEPPQEPLNLIGNSSFETNNNPSIDGWIYYCNTLSPFEFSNDVPASGGNWSVFLKVGDRVTKNLKAKVPAPVGQNRFRFSVWAKLKQMGFRGTPSEISLGLNNTIFKRLDIQDSVWKYYEAQITLTAIEGDSLTVTLDAGAAYYTQETYFDLCRLEMLR